MHRPSARVMVSADKVIVDSLAPDITVEVRDYNVAHFAEDDRRLWTDEKGRRCIQYFVETPSEAAERPPVSHDLERFVEDLRCHAGIPASFKPDDSGDGLHVLTINNADFYFNAYGSGYDGWGKCVNGADEA